MKQFRYNTAVINIKGKVDREKLEEVVKVFFRKVDMNKAKNN